MPPDRDSVSPDSPIITIDLSHSLEENGERKIWGRATIPKIDRENELITRQAIEDALQNFMALPILHYNHTERPIGWVVSAFFGDDDGLYVEARIKSTTDCDDIWKRIESGELTQFSIFGRRVEGNASCRLRPGHRDSPCVTSVMHLDSISVCPRGNAIQADSFLEIVKGWCGIEKASESTSALIHPTMDDVEKSEETMPNEDAGVSSPAPAVDQSSDQQSAIASVIQQVLDRQDALEERLDDLTAPDEGEAGGETVQKGDPDAEPGDEETEGDDGPDLNEILTTIGEALQIIITKLDKLVGGDQGDESSGDVQQEQVQKAAPDPEEEPDDGYEDEEDGAPEPEGDPEPETNEISKECPLKKAVESEPVAEDGEVDRQNEIQKARDEAKAEIEGLRSQITELKKAVVPKVPVVIPEIAKAVTEEKTSNAGVLSRLYGG